ncbi:hypothetical protein MMC30_006744 [Trapelia coarctata]|nr:hypothetical protein [Trapelia coarctata]
MSAALPSFPPGYLEEYNGAGPITVCVLFIVLETVCVALRFVARRLGGVAWGDIHNGGVGYHEAAVYMRDPTTLITWAKYTLIIPMVYLPAVVLPKMAILVLYLRIFITKPYIISCWTLAGLLIANWIGTTVAGFCICFPFEFLWNRSIPGGHCIDINAWYRWSSLMNIITDVIMLVLPLPVIWKIQSSRKVKIGLTITFAMGSLGLITAIIRFAGFFGANAAEDETWTASKLIILSVMESGVYLIAACLPTYRPLAKLIRRDASFSSLRKRYGRTAKSQTESRGQGLYDIPMDSRQKSGFARLSESRQPIATHARTETHVSGPEV